jgi:hypothetical protein
MSSTQVKPLSPSTTPGVKVQRTEKKFENVIVVENEYDISLTMNNEINNSRINALTQLLSEDKVKPNDDDNDDPFPNNFKLLTHFNNDNLDIIKKSIYKLESLILLNVIADRLVTIGEESKDIEIDVKDLITIISNIILSFKDLIPSAVLEGLNSLLKTIAITFKNIESINQDRINIFRIVYPGDVLTNILILKFYYTKITSRKKVGFIIKFSKSQVKVGLGLYSASLKVYHRYFRDECFNELRDNIDRYPDDETALNKIGAILRKKFGSKDTRNKLMDQLQATISKLDL